MGVDHTARGWVMVAAAGGMVKSLLKVVSSLIGSMVWYLTGWGF